MSKKDIPTKTRIFLILESLVPPILLDFFLDLFISIKFVFKKVLSKTKVINLPLKTSESAFIFATGPSLREFNFDLAKNSDCYGVSNFYLNEFSKSSNLKGHFFAPYHPPLVISEYVRWLREADQSLNKGTKIFLSSDTQHLVSENNLFKKREVVYLELEKGLAFGNVAKNRPILKPYTGPLMIVPILIMMGYKNIFLCGCDHTVLRDYGGTVKNFYEPEKDVRSNATNSERWSSGILHHLDNMIKIIKQYRRYKKIAMKHSSNIFNLSHDSWLEEFDFLSLEEVKRMIANHDD